MKVKFSFLLFILGLTLSAQSNATKEETFNWLKSRLDYHSQWDEKYWHELELIKIEGDTLFYKVHQLMDGKPMDGYTIDKIPVKDINPQRISIAHQIGDTKELVLQLFTNYGKKSIISDVYVDESGKLFVSISKKIVNLYLPDILIRTEGTEIAERTKIALQHLIELSGGVGEKF